MGGLKTNNGISDKPFSLVTLEAAFDDDLLVFFNISETNRKYFAFHVPERGNTLSSHPRYDRYLLYVQLAGTKDRNAYLLNHIAINILLFPVMERMWNAHLCSQVYRRIGS